MQSIVQIFKVNEPRSGEKNGRKWMMQDAECALLNETGGIEQVGVLMLPRELVGDKAPKPGVYTGTFSIRAGLRDRRIEAVLDALTLIPTRTVKPA